jgi:RimJ/RimL family protein N-acetyltransferase
MAGEVELIEPGGTLRLRGFTPEDHDAFHAIWGDPEVIWWGHDPDREASRARLERVIASRARRGHGIGFWAIVDEAIADPGARIVGDVVLQPAPFARGDLEIGWHLLRACWGRGYALRSARLLVRHAFDRLRLARVVAAIVPTNERSIAVAQRLGMRIEGRVMHGGMQHDLWVLHRDD